MTEVTVTDTVTTERTVDAPVIEPQETPTLEDRTDAEVAIIEAHSEADTARIAAQGEADVARIEAERRNTEWQQMMETEVATMRTTLTSIQQQLAQASTVTVVAQPGTPASTPPDQTADQSSALTEPSAVVADVDNNVLPTVEPPARAKRRKEVFL